MGKSKYETHVKPYFDDIFFWYSHDYSIEQIGRELGVSKDTIFKYKRTYSDFSDLLKKAEKSKPRNIAIKAEQALKDKLVEREVKEIQKEQWQGPDGKTLKQHVKTVTRVIPADTTAIIFALKSNDPARYGQQALLDKRLALLEQQIAKLTAEAEIAKNTARALSLDLGDKVIFVDSEDEMKRYMEEHAHEYEDTDK